MKKIIPICLVLAFIAPQVALASWWNPFSWSIFTRKDQKTLILENKVRELEDRLNKPQSVDEIAPSTTSPEKLEIARPSVVNKTTLKATQQTSTITNTAPSTPKPPTEISASTDDMFNTINIKINKLFDIRDSFEALGNTVNITKGDKNLIYTKQTEINAVIRDITQDKTNYSKIISQSAKSDLNKHITYLNSLISNLDKKISNFNEDYAQVKNNIPKNIEADKMIFVSDKEDRLKAVNLEIAQLNAKHAMDIEKANNCGGGYCTTSGVEASISNIERLYQIEYNKLQAKYQLIKYGN